jgi:hypothetical protein
MLVGKHAEAGQDGDGGQQGRLDGERRDQPPPGVAA